MLAKRPLPWLFVVAVLVTGCGPSSKSPTAAAPRGDGGSGRSSTSRQPPTERPAPRPASVVSPDQFASPDEAVAALCQAADQSESAALREADAWLTRQQEAAVPSLARVLEGEGASLAAKIAVCRTLRKLGPSARPTLDKATRSQTQLVRLNAVKGLGMVRPPDPQTVARLVGLLAHDDPRTRQTAIQALGQLGQSAGSAADALIAILNDPRESETLRGEAKKALREVDPRRTLVD